jgi:hypothetical protein
MTSLDDLDLVAQLHVGAQVMAALARSFRTIDRPVFADQCRDIGVVLHDLAHDLEAILKEQP